MASFRFVSAGLAFLFTAAALSGCMAVEDVPGELGLDQSADRVPVFSSNVAYLTVPSNADFAPFASFRGQTLVFDETNDSLMCTHVQAEMAAKYAEMKTPHNAQCAATNNGGQGLPAGMDATWSGYGKGGCGTWAVAVCNRVLGDTPPSDPVTKEEWNRIAEGIHQNADGGSFPEDRAKYYADKGYCVMDKRFDGTTADYQELMKKHLDGCDIKLRYQKRNADGSYTNGHVETVTGATQAGVTTSSWGKEAVVEGGSQGGFRHSEDGKSLTDPVTHGKLWPADATEVEVSYVCKCTAWEELVKKANAAW